MDLCLVVIQGPMKGTAYVLPRPGIYTVGRGDAVALSLAADTCVSRRHFVLQMREDALHARDCESLNGILVNGIRFGGLSPTGVPQASGDIRLRDKDEILVGESLLRVCVGDPPGGVQVVVADPEPDGGAAAANGPVPVPRSVSTQRQRFTPEIIEEDNTRCLDTPVIRGYESLRFLGAGSRGRIYLARHLESQELRAIKTVRLKPNLAETGKARFEREIATYQALRHPKIVGYCEHGFARDYLYVVLEYVPGGGLDQLMKLRDGRLPLVEVLPIMRDALEAMAFAHERGYVHRDLKPGNILLTGESGRWGAKVGDLGLAKSFVDIGAGHLSSRGEVGGSYGYMPREQLMDFRSVRPVSDVFALGATFYALLTGTLVYDLSAFTSPVEMVFQGKIIPIEERLPQLDTDLALVIDRAIAVDHEKRWQTAGEFRVALESIPGLMARRSD